MFNRSDVQTVRIDIPLRAGGYALMFVTDDDALSDPWWEEFLGFLHSLGHRTEPQPSACDGDLVERVELTTAQRDQFLELIERAPEDIPETQSRLRMAKLHLPRTDLPVRVAFFARFVEP